MVSISGDNVTLTASQFINYKDSVLTRTGLTADSTDLTPTAANLTSGINGPPWTTDYSFYIYNSSDTYKITLTCNTGFTMIPGPTDTIMPKTVKKYDVKIINQTTVEVYNLNHNGQQIVAEKIITNVIEKNSEDVQPVQIFNNTTQITLGSGPVLDVNTNGDVNIYGNIFAYTSVAYLTTNSNLTYTPGQILGGFIKRDISSNVTDKLPTAEDLVAAIKNPKVGTSFTCSVQQASDDNKKLTIQENTGITIPGLDTTIQRYYTLVLLFVITNPNVGSEAITCYVMGTLKDAKKGDVPNLKNVTTNSYTLDPLDDTINVDYSGSTWWWSNDNVTLTLPLISTVGQKRYHITDNGGNASRTNIVVVPSGSDTILGTDSFTINSNYASISLYNDEGSNWIIY